MPPPLAGKSGALAGCGLVASRSNIFVFRSVVSFSASLVYRNGRFLPYLGRVSRS